MNSGELFRDFTAGFESRKFSAGLLIAFIDFFDSLDAFGGKFQDLPALHERFPRRLKTAAGKRANTLIVNLPDGGTLSLRPFYNEAEKYFRAVEKRFDYPSCAPHATQAWADYHNWLNALLAFTPKQAKQLRERVVKHVLSTLSNQAFDPSSVQLEPPLFRLALESFELTAKKGEPTGAAFQGIVFGFLRADNPHQQIEIAKVRTGSKRLQRVGDIDAWEGERLAITAEVKQFKLSKDNLDDLSEFANESGRRGALGLVFALQFDEEARTSVIAAGLLPLDLEDMLNIVQLWDPVKQRTAVASLKYYFAHVEKNASLVSRLSEFLAVQMGKSSSLNSRQGSDEDHSS
jgi:hypothetical protein